MTLNHIGLTFCTKYENIYFEENNVTESFGEVSLFLQYKDSETLSAIYMYKVKAAFNMF